MQIVSLGDSLHELSDPFFLGENLHKMSDLIFWKKKIIRRKIWSGCRLLT